jgi:hypothetical protein
VDAGSLLFEVYDRRIDGTCLRVEHCSIHVDDHEVPVLETPRGVVKMLRQLVYRLGDVRLEAQAEPDGEVVVQFQVGVELFLSAGVLLDIRGAAMGPPDGLRLARPLTASFGGEGIRISHEQFKLLSRLASVRVRRATLHPDGRVKLEASATRGLNTAVRGGLHKVSKRVSTLVRTSPNYARVRTFLRGGDK